MFFFQYQENCEKKSEKYELLVFRLFAQVLSAKLPQRIFPVLKSGLFVIASAIVYFQGGTRKVSEKNSSNLFFRFNWCLL